MEKKPPGGKWLKTLLFFTRGVVNNNNKDIEKYYEGIKKIVS